MSDNDNAQPGEGEIAPATGPIPTNGNGAKIHVDPRLSPKQQERQARVEAVVEKRVKGKGGGTFNELINEVLDSEVMPAMERMGLHPRDMRVDIYREEPPGPKGQPVSLGGFSMDVAPTGHQLVQKIEDDFHCTRDNMGPASYRVTFRQYLNGTWMGDGRCHLDSYADIMARRELAQRRQGATGGRPVPPGMGYVPPAPPMYPQPYSVPQSPPYPQQPPVVQVHTPPNPQQPDAVHQFRESLGVVLELANKFGFTAQQPVAPAPAAPMTEERMAQVVAGAVVAGLKAAGIGQTATAPAPPQPPVDHAASIRSLGDFANAVLDGVVTLKKAVGRIDKEIGGMTGVGAIPNEGTAEPIPPEEEDDGTPFRVIPVPGVKTRDGIQMNFAEDKKTGKAHLWGLAVANPDLIGDAINKGVAILEKVVDANTINTKGE